MKIAAFYENIVEGIKQRGSQQSEKEVLYSLASQGLQRVYMDYRLLAADELRLMGLFHEVGLGVEGLYGFYEFGKNPTDENYIEHIDLAARVHANNVLIVPGFIEKDDERQKDILLENMKQAIAKIVQYGKIKDVIVSLEDFDSENSPLNNVEGLKWFLDRVVDLKCTFDTGNFIVYGEDALSAFTLFESKICAMHLKDRSHMALNEKDQPFILPNGEYIYPAPVGSGYIQIKEMLDSLKKNQYDQTVIIEMFGYQDLISGIEVSIDWLKMNGFS